MSFMKCAALLSIITMSLSSAAVQPNPKGATDVNGSTNNVAYEASLCAKTADNIRRLKCYDDIFLATFDNAPSSSKPFDDAVNRHTEVAKATTPNDNALNVEKPPQLSAKMVQSELPVAKVINPAPPENISSQVDEFGSQALRNRDAVKLTRISALVDTITEGPRKERTFYLDNGQVWRESSRDSVRFKVGMLIHIDKGALSSFHLSKNGNKRSTRVKRIK